MPRYVSLQSPHNGPVFLAMRTDRALRLKRLSLFITTAITGTPQVKIGYSGGTGAEIVAAVNVAGAAGSIQSLTIANAAVPAGTDVIVTPTAGTAGSYQVSFEWDSDY